jgi:hypothetical protein
MMGLIKRRVVLAEISIARIRRNQIRLLKGLGRGRRVAKGVAPVGRGGGGAAGVVTGRVAVENGGGVAVENGGGVAVKNGGVIAGTEVLSEGLSVTDRR